MSIDRVNVVGNIIYVLIVINMQTHPYIYVQRGNIFSVLHMYQRGIVLCRSFFLMPQMTGTKHENGTTLRVQPYRTAAVVGYIMHKRVVSPLYAEASCFRLHEGTTSNRTTIETIQRNFS